MGGGHHVRPRRVHLRVDGKRGAVQASVSLHYVAAIVHQNQIRDPHLAEVLPKGIDPKMIGQLRIAGGDVACHALVESESREQAEGCSQPLLSMLPLLSGAGECGRLRSTERSYTGSDHGDYYVSLSLSGKTASGPPRSTAHRTRKAPLSPRRSQYEDTAGPAFHAVPRSRRPAD